MRPTPGQWGVIAAVVWAAVFVGLGWLFSPYVSVAFFAVTGTGLIYWLAGWMDRHYAKRADENDSKGA